jgi:hypothetical protein
VSRETIIPKQGHGMYLDWRVSLVKFVGKKFLDVISDVLWDVGKGVRILIKN